MIIGVGIPDSYNGSRVSKSAGRNDKYGNESLWNTQRLLDLPGPMGSKIASRPSMAGAFRYPEPRIVTHRLTQVVQRRILWGGDLVRKGRSWLWREG